MVGQYGSMSRLPRALATAPLRGPGLRRLRTWADVIHEPWIDQNPLRIYDAPALAERIDREQATIVIVESDLVSGPVFELPLVAVAVTRGDPNNVDLAGATAAGVPVLHTPGRNADAVAELTLGLLLALSRHMAAAAGDAQSGQVFRNGTIPYQRFRGSELAGRTAGLIGLGAVGRATKWRLEALGLTVVTYDPHQPDAGRDLPDLLAQSDIVSMHAALTAKTSGMIGPKEFATMKEGALFLNTARAGLHDTDALVEALRSGQLGGAALDHVDGEMLPEGHPLLGWPNVVITPHIGGATTETEARGTLMIADDLERLLRGQRPTHIANPEVL
jgi:D-3-phosphoglycerate dehydrogenase